MFDFDPYLFADTEDKRIKLTLTIYKQTNNHYTTDLRSNTGGSSNTWPLLGFFQISHPLLRSLPMVIMHIQVFAVLLQIPWIKLAQISSKDEDEACTLDDATSCSKLEPPTIYILLQANSIQLIPDSFAPNILAVSLTSLN